MKYDILNVQCTRIDSNDVSIRCRPLRCPTLIATTAILSYFYHNCAHTKSTSKAAKKALEVNLNPPFYGVLAEIGAGQEVARCFFQVGTAAGTVAKAIPAYGMQVG